MAHGHVAYLNHQEVEPLHPNSRRQWQFYGTRDANKGGEILVYKHKWMGYNKNERRKCHARRYKEYSI